RGGQARIALVERNQRVERLDAHGPREGGVREDERAHRKPSLELGMAEMGDAREGVAARAGTEPTCPFGAVIAGQIAGERAVEDTRVQHLAAAFGLDGEVGKAVADALGGAIEDFPVDQPAGAREAYRPRADAAQGEGDVL